MASLLTAAGVYLTVGPLAATRDFDRSLVCLFYQTVGLCRGSSSGNIITRVDSTGITIWLGIAARSGLRFRLNLRPPENLTPQDSSNFVIAVGCWHTTDYDGVPRQEPHGLRPYLRV